MKLSTQLIKRKRRQEAKKVAASPGGRADGPFAWSRWTWVVLCLILAGGGTWAVVHFFTWHKLPAGLIGTWEVHEGPMKGGTFQFSGNGTLAIHSSNQGTDYTLKGRVAVQDKILLTTTQNPSSRRDETSKSIIRELTANSLILELEKGAILKMARRQ
jgi:hypothetical protein